MPDADNRPALDGGPLTGVDERIHNEIDSDLAQQFVGLADALFDAPGEGGVIEVVGRVVRVAAAIVPGAAMVSVMMRCGDEELDTIVSSDDLAVRADRLQVEEGEGPSLDATVRDGVGVALAGDLLTEQRWPRSRARLAAETGVRSVLATGMFPGGDPPRFGVMSFYSRSPGELDAADRDHALVLAAHAATAISAVEARTAAELREVQLYEALRSRDVIGQAKGILMERRGLGSDEAFDVLRRTSQELNVKLREVAETLVSRRAEL